MTIMYVSISICPHCCHMQQQSQLCYFFNFTFPQTYSKTWKTLVPKWHTEKRTRMTEIGWTNKCLHHSQKGSHEYHASLCLNLAKSLQLLDEKLMPQINIIEGKLLQSRDVTLPSNNAKNQLNQIMNFLPDKSRKTCHSHLCAVVITNPFDQKRKRWNLADLRKNLN